MGIGAITTTLFSQYTKEEMTLLLKCINDRVSGNKKMYWGLPIRRVLQNTMCDPPHMCNYPLDADTDFEMFTEELIKMPLHINDEDPEKSGIAVWRLKLGR